jgi:hypothetical protein
LPAHFICCRAALRNHFPGRFFVPSLTNLWQTVAGVRRRGQEAVQRWTKGVRAHPPFKRTLPFEALEQRILMSADIVGSIQVSGEVDKYVFTVWVANS